MRSVIDLYHRHSPFFFVLQFVHWHSQFRVFRLAFRSGLRSVATDAAGIAAAEARKLSLSQWHAWTAKAASACWLTHGRRRNVVKDGEGSGSAGASDIRSHLHNVFVAQNWSIVIPTPSFGERGSIVSLLLISPAALKARVRIALLVASQKDGGKPSPEVTRIRGCGNRGQQPSCSVGSRGQTCVVALLKRYQGPNSAVSQLESDSLVRWALKESHLSSSSRAGLFESTGHPPTFLSDTRTCRLDSSSF